MPSKCIALFSGGLDSIIACHLLKQQGIEVIALHFVLPFDHGIKSKLDIIISFANQLGARLIIQQDGEDFTDMLKNPSFGFGKHANPCIDCRIRRLKKTKEIMSAEGAQFIATGEVVGQRPMSQRRDSLNIIEKHAGLLGYLLRPLSAGLLKPTVAEQERLVNRELLLSIQGRGRKEQLAYAARFGLASFPPAGGCLLTKESAAAKVVDLKASCPDFTFSDIQLLSIGRHFRIMSTTRFIVARDEPENSLLEKFILPGDYRFDMVGALGPVGLGRGIAEDEESIQFCCRILARYCKARCDSHASVSVTHNNRSVVYSITPASPADCDSRKI
ncbi:MAG: hypothetical protein PHC61_05895 [Chitinivibrionales bacterium]|nr:hypothetical protein [Chitinivibrionales bacterium]